MRLFAAFCLFLKPLQMLHAASNQMKISRLRVIDTRPQLACIGARLKRVGAAGNDRGVLKANKVKYQLFKYPGTQHGFNNDTTPRYDKAAATLAWQRTVEFFKKNLRG